MPDLLIELFSEEIPARMQARASADLKRMMTDAMVEAGLTYASAQAFATPRRLALTVEGLSAESPLVREERRGPKVGAPDKAIEGFCRGAGVTRDQLVENEEKKGSFYFATIETPGRPAAAIVAETLEHTIRHFPWPKSMRWGSGSLRWVRPLHSILCLLSTEEGADIVPLEVDGIVSGATTQGHRFLAPAQFTVTGFDDYSAKLKRAFVVLDPAERADAIWNDATNMAFASGLEVVEDKGLLAEVAGLVEWPVVLMGEIGQDFLGLPPEVLQTSMKEHQKFFSVRNPKTGRIERFVTVANRETADQGATILAGNQKVLAARLADAVFFWENDLRVAKSDLSVWQDNLKTVTYHAKLGSVADQVDRITALARDLAPVVGAGLDTAAEAARLAKADLTSEMVYEFPELQGVMGRYYSHSAGFSTEISTAVEEHYAPLGPTDTVPTAPVSVAVSLAEKLDKLTGFWAIQEKPTGSKDPFALRRAALGVIRLVLENEADLSLLPILTQSVGGAQAAVQAHWLRMAQVQGTPQNRALNAWFRDQSEKATPDPEGFLSKVQAVAEKLSHDSHAPEDLVALVLDNLDIPPRAANDLAADLLAFIHDRLKVYLRDEGLRYDVIDACIAMDGSDDLARLVARARALQGVLGTEDGENLVQGFKRANNILTQAEEKDGVEYSFGAERKFVEEPQETALFDALDAAEPAIESAMAAQDFAAAMQAMASMRPAVDAFFEAVQVNAESDIIRRNRLNLLSRIRTTCGQVADLTKLEG